MINLKTAALRFVRATDNLREGVGREEVVAEAIRVLEQSARDFAAAEAKERDGVLAKKRSKSALDAIISRASWGDE